MVNAYDIETFVDENNNIIPYCICFIHKKKYYHIYYKEKCDIINESLKLILSLKLNKNNVFYVHNLNFDGILILISLSSNKTYKFDVFLRDNSIYYIKISYNDVILEFKCSFKILPISLKNISYSFSLPSKMIFPYKFSKKENLNYIGKAPESFYFNSEQDYETFKIHNNGNFNFKEYSIEYCKRDVEIVSLFVNLLSSMLNDINIDLKKSYSAPSLSLKIFNERFNIKKIKLSNSNLIDSQIRQSYFGGRCEVYGNPYDDENIYHFDFSGMYGKCMKEKFCFGKYYINTDCKIIKKPGYYFIEYYSDMYIPVLPHHNFINKKLLFTNGVNKGLYWFEEIILFIEMGGIIKKIHYSIEFENFDYVFSDFIDYFENIRNKGNDYKTFAKLMVNSLYGRIGMQEVNTHSFFIKKEEFNYYNKKYKILDYIELNGYIMIKVEIDQKFKKENDIKKTKNNISIASAITSKARIKLYKAQQNCIANGGRILYSDTDSLYVAYKKNVLNQTHGEVYWDPKKDDTEIKDAVFISPKTYGIVYKKKEKESIKIKGYNSSNIDFINLKKKFYENKDIEVNDFFYIKKSDFSLKNFIINKKYWISKYDKRIFLYNKKETRALNFLDYVYF